MWLHIGDAQEMVIIMSDLKNTLNDRYCLSSQLFHRHV